MPHDTGFLEDEDWHWALRERRMRRGKLYFGILALAMIVLGLAIYIFSSALNIDETTAKLIALAFLIAGFFDYLILYFWDKIYDKFGPPKG